MSRKLRLWAPHARKVAVVVDGEGRAPVGHGRLAWTDAGWRPPPIAAVVYGLHVGPDCTFNRARDERLGHLVSPATTARLGAGSVVVLG